MENPKNIRNISVIAHVDHGKSTLTDSLVSKAGIIAKEKAGEARFTDTRPDEQERSITIKSTSLINLIDSPGHVDFSSEVTAALRVTDGALVVVDCVEGVCIQTETVLRQAVSERIKPVLFLNKLDRIFIETEIEFEEAYINFRKIIENVNVIISTYKDMENVNLQVDPVVGNVGFGSGAHAWGFTIRQFAEMYAQDEAGVNEYTKRFWGDHFYNPKTRKWANKAISGEWVRGFCYFVMRPLKRFIKCMMDGESKTMDSFVKKMKIPLPEDVETLKGKELMKNVMRNWIPAGDALLTMIVKHIPSPVQAQHYRYETLYTGELNDEFAISIRDCNQKGPLVLFVSKMVPAIEKGKFYAFGRVFSGCVTSGQRVRIMGANFSKEDNHDVYTKNIQRTVLMMGRFVEQIVDVPAGNVVGLVGVDDVILKSATIVDHGSVEAMPLKMMKFSVSPVVSVAVDTKNAQDLPRLVEGLKKLSKSDPLVTCMRNSTGQHIIAGAGELHLEICLKDLGEFMKGSEVRVSDPVVTFCETVTRETEKVCVAKSPNKHNRIYMTAEPLAEGICGEIEDKKLTENMDVKLRAARLSSEYGWDQNEARKIWSFGCVPEATANILLDASKGVQYLNEIKDSMKGAFMRATSAGVICDERMRGVTFKIVDVTLHADAIHRGAGQIMPAARRAFCACQLSAGPGLLEPVYTVEISVPQQSISGVYSVLNKNRGVVEEEKRNPSNPIMKMVCSLPVMESMGFVSKLRAETAGQAFAQMSFSHWQPLSGELADPTSKTYSVVMDVRKRKGMVEEIPDFNDYYDRV